jgi:hypothetical protein
VGSSSPTIVEPYRRATRRRDQVKCGVSRSRSHGDWRTRLHCNCRLVQPVTGYQRKIPKKKERSALGSRSDEAPAASVLWRLRRAKVMSQPRRRTLFAQNSTSQQASREDEIPREHSVVARKAAFATFEELLTRAAEWPAPSVVRYLANRYDLFLLPRSWIYGRERINFLDCAAMTARVARAARAG